MRKHSRMHSHAVLAVLAASMLALVSCQGGGPLGDAGTGLAGGLSDLGNVAANASRAAGQNQLAGLIETGTKPFDAQALNDPKRREATAIALGQTLSLKVIATVGPVVRDDALERYVNLVCESIALQTPRYNQRWYVAILWNDKPTGVSLPHGYIYLTSGLLRTLKDEAELAAVIAHEVDHVVQEDGMKMYQQQLVKGFGAGVVVAVGGDKGRVFMQSFNQLFDVMITGGFPREAEIRADRNSVKYVYEAGYYPAGLMHFMERAETQPGLNHEEGKEHPSPAQRVAALKSALGTLGPYQNMPRNADRYRKMALDRIESLRGTYDRIKAQRVQEQELKRKQLEEQERQRQLDEQRKQQEEKQRKADKAAQKKTKKAKRKK